MPSDRFPQSQESSPKEIYFNTIKRRVEELRGNGQIPDAYANGVLERAGHVEGPFANTGEATEMARLFLTAIEPIAQYCSKLRDAETQLLTLAADIHITLENLSSRNDLSDAKKKELSSNLETFRSEIDQFLEKIKIAQSQVV
jgi:hypothetical protein